MRLLFISTLYPSSVQPARATYSRSLLTAMLGLGHEVRVIAPVPWFPCAGRFSPRYRLPPRREVLDGIPVEHPRFPVIPRVLVRYHHLAYRAAVRSSLVRSLADDRPQHVMVGFAYPDAVAMLPLCLRRGVDCSVQVLGSDFRLRSRQPGFGRVVTRTLAEAPRIFCPGEALRRVMIDAGLAPEKIVAFQNGFDARLFFPPPAGDDAPGPAMVLFVGNLLPVKGADRLPAIWQAVAAAAGRLQPPLSAELAVAGAGPLHRRLVADLGPAIRGGSVRLLGPVPHERVGELMRSARCLLLASRSEGMPNVVIEALACGVPVVATAVGEVPYLVQEGVNGFAVAPDGGEAETCQALAAALVRSLSWPWDRRTVAGTVAPLSWENAARQVLAAIATPPPGVDHGGETGCRSEVT